MRSLPVEIEGRLEYEVESVDGERNNADGDTEYLIRWKGHGMTERTWEHLANLEHTGEAIITWNVGRVDGNSARSLKKSPTAKARAVPTRSSPRRSPR